MFSRIIAARTASAVRANVNLSATPACVRAFSAQTFLDRGEVEERVFAVVKNFEKVDPGKVTAAANFIDDLGLDSLDTVEVVMAFEDEFCVEIPDAEAEKIATCEHAIAFLASHPQAK